MRLFRFTFIALVAIAAVFGASALDAQTHLPKATGRVFDDLAGVMTASRADAVEAHVRETIARYGHEFLVLIVPDAATCGSKNLATLAGDLMHERRVGAARSGKGVVLIVGVSPKEAALALGSAYPPEAENIGIDVTRNVVALPLESNDYAAAVEFGVSVTAMRLDARDYSPPIDDVPAWAIALPLGVIGTMFLLAIVLIVTQRRRRERERMLGGFSGPDAETLAKDLRSDEMFAAPPEAQTAFERPKFDRPESPR